MERKRVLGAVALTAGVILGAFLGAWLERGRSQKRADAVSEVQLARTEQLESEIGRLRTRGELSELQLDLGRVALEADRQDYGTAGVQASRFFEKASKIAQRTDDEQVRSALQTVLATRDEVIAELASAQPAATETLKRLYLDLVARL